MANGKVCTGFSKPYVALYNASAGVVSYTKGRILARGVKVSIEPNTSDDNKFYADNQEAESAAGTFTGGTITLTVDGLFISAERFIMGLPDAGSDGFTAYGDSQKAPNVGVGYIARYMSEGNTTYVPTVMAKVKFNQPPSEAATQEEDIDWQTQELTGTVMRGDDENHNWKFIGDEYTSEDEAEAALKAKLGIAISNPVVSAENSDAMMFGTLVSDMQSNVAITDNAITGTLKKLTDGALVDRWGEGNFIALKFSNIDQNATSVKVGLDPSEGDGLVEIIDDPDKNGAFKITNKNTQVFKVVSTNGTTAATATYSLKGLKLED